MNEIALIDQVETLLEWYARIYRPSVHLDGSLITEWPELPKTAPKIQMAPVPHISQGSEELEAYYQKIKDCKNCRLGELRKNFVFGCGNPKADLMLIGEAPGYEEDLQGLPFVGAAGKLLTRMLHAIGLDRDMVYIANILKCRPPNNRDPLPDEVEQCEPYLKHQIELIKPKIILGLGRISGQTLLKRTDTLTVLRESEQRYLDIPLIVTYHPAALLRNPQWKEHAWQDLKKVKKFLNSHA